MQVVCNLSPIGCDWLSRSEPFAQVVKTLLDAQVRNNLLYLSRHRVPPLYRSGVRYENEPEWKFDGRPAEEFALIPTIIARGWGDCLPRDSLVLLASGSTKPICELEIGESVMTHQGPAPVTEVRMTDPSKPVFRYRTEGSGELFASKEHRFNHFDPSALTVSYVPARKLSVGHLVMNSEMTPVKVTSIEPAAMAETWDITVGEAHHFFAKSPASKLWLDVHNCDDLSPWRCAELIAIGEPATIRIQWKRRTLPNGKKSRKLFHIVVRRGDRVTIEDPSALLGMYDRTISDT